MSGFAPGTTAVSNEVLAHLLLSAFRYSLGRRTYMVGACREWLEAFWHLLPPAWQAQVHRHIREAIAAGCAGDPCDVMEWRKVLRLGVAASATDEQNDD